MRVTSKAQRVCHLSRIWATWLCPPYQSTQYTDILGMRTRSRSLHIPSKTQKSRCRKRIKPSLFIYSSEVLPKEAQTDGFLETAVRKEI